MIDEGIYKLWLPFINDLRYLRPRRWNEIKKVILEYRINSVLEFGSGISTLLFDNLGMSTLSLETDIKYLNKVKSFCSSKVTFKHWDNKSVNIDNHYGLSLVDGTLPREIQLNLAIKHSNFIAMDDFEKEIKESLSSKLTSYTRIDKQITTMAIFRKSNG